MATSGVVVLTRTAGEIIAAAYRMATIVAHTQTVTAAQNTTAIYILNDMLQSWAADDITPWRKDLMTVTPVQGQELYTLSPRPLEIIEARYVPANGNEIPMTELNHDDYYRIPQKDIEGTPTQFYYKRNRDNGQLYIWPAPSVVTTDIIRLSYSRSIEVVGATSENVDIPQEWHEALRYNLAAKLGDEYQVSNPVFDRVIARADMLYNDLRFWENTGQVRFEPDVAQ